MLEGKSRFQCVIYKLAPSQRPGAIRAVTIPAPRFVIQLTATEAMNNKRSTIIFLSALVLLVLALSLLITAPFLKPFAFAVILAVVFYPLHQRILRLTKKRNGLGSLLSTFTVVMVFGVPAFLIVTIGGERSDERGALLEPPKRRRRRLRAVCYQLGGRPCCTSLDAGLTCRSTICTPLLTPTRRR